LAAAIQHFRYFSRGWGVVYVCQSERS
jgi:hypothetical protein